MLGIKDVVPRAQEDGYEGFEVLIDRATRLAQEIRMICSSTNIESLSSTEKQR